MEYGIEYLRGKLSQKQTRVNLRYKYYEMKNEMRRVSALIPPEFRTLIYALGWCGKAVDTLSDRIVFDEFDNDIANLNEIYKLNNSDVLHGSAVLSALISSCSFLYVGQRDDGYPTIECIDGGNATGIIDSTTNLLTEGYAILKRDDYGQPEIEAYFLPHKTEYYRIPWSEKLVKTSKFGGHCGCGTCSRRSRSRRRRCCRGCPPGLRNRRSRSRRPRPSRTPGRTPRDRTGRTSRAYRGRTARRRPR